MTKDDLREILGEIQLLYPTCDDERLAYAKRSIEGYPEDKVREALRELATEGDKFFQLPRLIALIARRIPQARQSVAELEARSRHANAERDRVKAEWEAVCGEVNAYSDDELAEMKAQVIAALPSIINGKQADIRATYERSNPRTSKAMILEIHALLHPKNQTVRNPTESRHAPAYNGIEL